jgi:hypothetical protein
LVDGDGVGGAVCDIGAFEAPIASPPTTTTTTLPTAGGIDSFNCYKAKDLRNPPFAPETAVTLIDQFATSVVDLIKLSAVCAPADKDGAGVSDPATHLCCYRTKGSTLPEAVRAQIQDEGGDLQLEIKKASTFCRPCSKTPLP